MTKQNEKDAKRVPELRFKGFTDDWEQRKLGEIAEEVKGNSGSINNIPILTISAANGWMNQKDRFSQIIAGNELKKYTLLKKGELSYNHGNSKLAKYGTVFVQDSHDQALVPRVYHSFKMVAQNNPYFIEYLFASGLPNKELSKIVTSGARMDGLLNINKKEFFSIKLNNPSSEEQSKIAKLFQSLDKTITLHEEKQRQLEQLKKALLQKMFADETGYPALRFKNFTEKWEQRKFSDIYKKSSEKNDLSFSKDKVISVANNKWGTAPKNSTDKYMRTYYVYRIGDIAFEGNKSKKFKFGRFVENTLANGIVSHVFDIYRPTQKEHDLWFWKYYIHNENIMRDVLRKSTTKATMMTNLVNKDLLKQKLNIPSIEEQEKIGNYLSKLDHLITLHQHKIDNLKRLKRALLQKMFV